MASKVLLLGGTGTVGSFLKQTLPDYYSVSAPTRQELNLLDCYAVNNYLRTNNFDVVINCAANTNSSMETFDARAAETNLSMFTGLLLSKNHYGRLINFGSGAEFDRRKDITDVLEDELFLNNPIDHYGMSKNICSRVAYSTENFYTLRLFGVFGPTEPNYRLLKRINTKQPIVLHDKYFDYYYVNDILPVVRYYIDQQPEFKDINLVYEEKYLLSNFVKLYQEIHNLNDNITISKTKDFNYTGNGSKLASLNLPLLGITHGLKNYF